MNYELIFGGVILLVSTLLVRFLKDRCAFEVMVVCFTLVWSLFAALHAWAALYVLMGTKLKMAMAPGTLALLSYWTGAGLAALPGIALMLFWLKGYQTTFPPLLDAALVWSSALVTAVAVALIFMMSIGLVERPPSADDEDEWDEPSYIARVYYVGRRIPIQAYLHVATNAANPTSPENVLRRIPPRGAWLLLGDGPFRRQAMMRRGGQATRQPQPMQRQ